MVVLRGETSQWNRSLWLNWPMAPAAPASVRSHQPPNRRVVPWLRITAATIACCPL